MILKEGAKFYRVQSLTKQLWNWKSRKQCGFLSYTLLMVFLALFFDISRMGGAVYESFIDRFIETDLKRLTGFIKGPCISYDTTTQKLLTTPHNTGCSNYADEFIIFSASGIILSIFVVTPIFFAFIRYANQKKDLREHPMIC